MKKRILLSLLIFVAFFFGITFAYAEEENIVEEEDKQQEVVEVPSEDSTPTTVEDTSDTSAILVTEDNTSEVENVETNEPTNNVVDEVVVGNTDNDDPVVINNEGNDTEVTTEVVNGYSVTFSFNNKDYVVNGGSEIYFSRLRSKLDMIEVNSTISNVVSSNDELLQVTRVGNNDFIIKSLKSFETEEYITVYYTNGYIQKIRVNDPDDLIADETYNPLTDYTGTKVWDDGDDTDQIRPTIVDSHVDESVFKIVLRARVGTTGSFVDTDYVAEWSVSADDPNVWNYVFKNIPIFDAATGEVIYYEVVETVVPTGYDNDDTYPTHSNTPTDYTIDIESIDGSDIEKNEPCNTETFDISETPTDIFFIVVKNRGNTFFIWTPRAVSETDKAAIEAEIEASHVIPEFKENRVIFAAGYQRFELAGGWVEFSKSGDNQILMELSDTSVWSYWCEALLGSEYITYNIGTTDITNHHQPTTQSITVIKEWDGNYAQDGVEIPESIQVQLYAGNETVGRPVTITDNNGEWSYTWTGLAINDEDGNPINYWVEEIETELIKHDEVNGTFHSVVDGFTITNTYITQKRDITVTKEWEGDYEKDGVQIPDSIEVTLYAGDTPVGDPVNITAEDGWSYTWYGLEVNDENGDPINYRVEETETDLVKLDEEDGTFHSVVDGFTITNTYITQKRDITVTKEWDGDYEQDGVEIPDSIEVTLYAGDTPVGDPVNITAEDGWSYTWYGLEVNDENGDPINYRVEETETDLVKLDEEDGTFHSVVDGFTITNTYINKVRKITVNKVWDDRDDYEGLRPDSVTILLLVNGDVVGEATLDEESGWKYTFEVDYYEDGTPIEYEIDEEKVDGYDTEITGSVEKGFTVTNTHSGTGGDDPEPENPKTADNIYTYVIMMIISLIGLLTVSYSYCKNN